MAAESAPPDVRDDGPELGSTGCSATPVEPGDSTVKLTFGGFEREYLLHVPPPLAGRKWPLLLAFHGLMGHGETLAVHTGLRQKADTSGFVLALPIGGSSLCWNAGTCCGQCLTSKPDDVGFARAVVADVQNRLCIATRRVYAAGLSNGGMLSHRLACEAADVFAAVAAVAGPLTLPAGECKPSRAVSVLHIHGTADKTVPYWGNERFSSAPLTFTDWASRAACTDEKPATTFSAGDSSCQTYSACRDDARVTLCTVEGGGHCWPGQRTECSFGMATPHLVATDAIWDFLSRVTL